MFEKTHLAQWQALHRNAWMASLHTWWGCQFSTATSTFSGEVCRCHCRDAGEGLEVCKPCGSVFESGDEARHPSRGARKQDQGHRSYRNHRSHRSSNCEPVVRSSKSRPSFSVQGRESLLEQNLEMQHISACLVGGSWHIRSSSKLRGTHSRP